MTEVKPLAAEDSTHLPSLAAGEPVDVGLLAAIVDNMFAGVALVKVSDASILYANPQFARMFGYLPGELEGKPISILNAGGAHSPEEVAQCVIAQLKREGVWRGEVENVRKDGRRIWCQANVTTFDHPRHGPVWVVVQLDVSARHLAQRELRKSEERLGLVLEVTGAGAWDWNVLTGEVYLSPYWLKSLGYDPGDLEPNVRSWEGLVHPDDLARVREAVAAHFEGRTEHFECVNRLRRKDGSWRWNLDRGQVVERAPHGEPLRMVGTDTDLSLQSWSGLSETVPICAGCRKIRDDSGEWRVLELHFGERSLAQFSHGLCPHCVSSYFDPLDGDDV